MDSCESSLSDDASGNRRGECELLHTPHISAVSDHFEQHHPSLNISPASDYRPTHTALQRPDAATGYVIEISSHTHTPLPTLKSKVEAAQTTTIGQSVETKPAPGVTGKDLKLAERLEAAYEDIMGTKAES